MRRLLLITAILLSVLAFSNSTKASAAGDYFNVTFTGNGTCDDSNATLPFSIAYSVSTDTDFYYTEKVNGTQIDMDVYDTLYAPDTGTYDNFDYFASFTATQPYTLSLTLSSSLGSGTATYRCVGGIAYLQNGVPGPGSPVGFVLRVITCNTALFNLEGNPIGSNAVKAGQSFFINSTTKTIKGKSYTELFAGSYSNGFVPTSCIGGKPAGYTGS